VDITEPADVQLQDLVERPLGSGTFSVSASAHWQVRICDLVGCLQRTHLDCEPVRFNLELSDPIAGYLGGEWHGLAGEYVVTLGPESRAEPGTRNGLPSLEASVNAFSRMWLGVRPATGLAATGGLAGPEELLRRLDRALRLPTPNWDWPF
jgi:hypothetical protein